MKSPTLRPFGQGSAQGCAGVFTAFAMGASGRHCFTARQGRFCRDPRGLRCYPSPSLRSGPSQAGPILMGGVAPKPGCHGATATRIRFETRDIAVESAAITTNSRGSFQCASRFFFSSFCPCRWPDACRTPRRAAWLVLQPAPLSPTRPTATCLPGPSSAAWPVSQPAASRSACRPVTRATDTAACERSAPHSRTIRAARPGGPFLCA